MKAVDTMEARGSVAPYFLDIRTGRMVPFGRRHNTLSFAAADAMAAAFGGDLSRIPNRIGIIYGSDVDNPALTISRDQSWAHLEEELMDAEADVQIRPFSSSPTLGKHVRPDPAPESSSSSNGSSPSQSSGDSGGSSDPMDFCRTMSVMYTVGFPAEYRTVTMPMVEDGQSNGVRSASYSSDPFYLSITIDDYGVGHVTLNGVHPIHGEFAFHSDIPDIDVRNFTASGVTYTGAEFSGEFSCAEGAFTLYAPAPFPVSAEIPYSNNAVTFHTHSDSVTPGAFSKGSSASIFSTGNKIFQAVLLNVRPSSDPEILARVDLADAGAYRSKPEGFEIALDWTVRFF